MLAQSLHAVGLCHDMMVRYYLWLAVCEGKKKIKKPKNPKNWISGLLLNLSQTFSREFETKKTKSGFPSPTALKLFNLLLGWVLCKFLKKKKKQRLSPGRNCFFFTSTKIGLET